MLRFLSRILPSSEERDARLMTNPIYALLRREIMRVGIYMNKTAL